MSTRTAVLCVVALLAGGCALLAEEPPEEVPQVTVPDLVDVSAAVSSAGRVRLPRLARDSAARRARRITVRVRNLSCQGVALGSGVALGPDLLMTNRHVLAGAEDLEVSTWNGRTFDVSSAQVGVLGDIGLVRVEGRLPLAGAYGRPPEAGDPVTAVGYPRGGPLTLSEGVVVDRVDGANFDVPGTVVRLTATVRPGNSGGPCWTAAGASPPSSMQSSGAQASASPSPWTRSAAWNGSAVSRPCRPAERDKHPRRTNYVGPVFLTKDRGRMLRFERSTFSGSYFSLISTRRSKLAP